MTGPAPFTPRIYLPPSLGTLDAPSDDARADLEAAARAAAYQQGMERGAQEGHARGVAEGKAAATKDAVAAAEQAAKEHSHNLIAKASANLQAALEMQDEVRRAADMHARAAVAAALQAVFPVLLAERGGREAAAVIADAATSRPGVELEIHAHAETIAALSALSTPLIPSSERMQIVEANTLQPGAVDIRWTTEASGAGGLAFDAAELARRVLTAVASPADGSLAKNPGDLG